MNKEDKNLKFKRVATKRVNDILKKFDLLENCANKSHYNYTNDEVNKIFKTLEKRLKEVKASYKLEKQLSKDFKL
jgi:DNA-binding transcriptional regulator GbsR (MarR family)